MFSNYTLTCRCKKQYRQLQNPSHTLPQCNILHSKIAISQPDVDINPVGSLTPRTPHAAGLCILRGTLTSRKPPRSRDRERDGKEELNWRGVSRDTGSVFSLCQVIGCWVAEPGRGREVRAGRGGGFSKSALRASGDAQSVSSCRWREGAAECAGRAGDVGI